jgi:hypothetical protein
MCTLPAVGLSTPRIMLMVVAQAGDAQDRFAIQCHGIRRTVIAQAAVAIREPRVDP